MLRPKSGTAWLQAWAMALLKPDPSEAPTLQPFPPSDLAWNEWALGQLQVVGDSLVKVLAPRTPTYQEWCHHPECTWPAPSHPEARGPTAIGPTWRASSLTVQMPRLIQIQPGRTEVY